MQHSSRVHLAVFPPVRRLLPLLAFPSVLQCGLNRSLCRFHLLPWCCLQKRVMLSRSKCGLLRFNSCVPRVSLSLLLPLLPRLSCLLNLSCPEAQPSPAQGTGLETLQSSAWVSAGCQRTGMPTTWLQMKSQAKCLSTELHSPLPSLQCLTGTQELL